MVEKMGSNFIRMCDISVQWFLRSTACYPIETFDLLAKLYSHLVGAKIVMREALIPHSFYKHCKYNFFRPSFIHFGGRHPFCLSNGMVIDNRPEEEGDDN